MFNFTPRRIVILLLLIATPFLLSAMFSRDVPQKEWPIPEIGIAVEIPLTEAYDMLADQDVAREGGVLDGYIYIRDAIPAQTPEAPLVASGDAAIEPDAPAVTYKALLPFPSHVFLNDLIKVSGSPIRVHSNHDYSPTLLDRVIQIFPILLIVLIAVVLLKRGGMRTLGLNASFSVIDPSAITDSFETVAGIDEARAELEEIVDFLKDPKAASRLGGAMPKGVIFSGPPGTGKTLLARAMAREANVPFLTIEAAGINQLFVGAGAMKIKRAFREARKQAPCIVFIDEIDAMGRARGNSHSGAGDEKETTLNALLVELDGFDGREGVVVVAATNRPEILDRALVRRGRIDRHIHVDLPDVEGRREILEVHAARIKTFPGLDLTRVAETTFGFSGADLKALVNEAALVATRAQRDHVELADFSFARDRLLVGLSGSQRQLNELDRRKTARHEAGHAMIAAVLEHADPVEKATILPQGAALGYVLQAPQEDKVLQTRDELVDRIRVAVAGRVAEELFYGPGGVTTGAASDIKGATRVATAMVLDYGMSDYGFIHVGLDARDMDGAHRPALSEIRNIIATEMSHVRDFLKAHLGRLEGLAQRLEGEETIDGASIMAEFSDLRGSFAKG